MDDIQRASLYPEHDLNLPLEETDGDTRVKLRRGVGQGRRVTMQLSEECAICG